MNVCAFKQCHVRRIAGRSIVTWVHLLLIDCRNPLHRRLEIDHERGAKRRSVDSWILAVSRALLQFQNETYICVCISKTIKSVFAHYTIVAETMWTLTVYMKNKKKQNTVFVRRVEYVYA